jgi:hypothetical protein
VSEERWTFLVDAPRRVSEVGASSQSAALIRRELGHRFFQYGDHRHKYFFGFASRDRVPQRSQTCIMGQRPGEHHLLGWIRQLRNQHLMTGFQFANPAFQLGNGGIVVCVEIICHSITVTV